MAKTMDHRPMEFDADALGLGPYVANRALIDDRGNVSVRTSSVHNESLNNGEAIVQYKENDILYTMKLWVTSIEHRQEAEVVDVDGSHYYSQALTEFSLHGCVANGRVEGAKLVEEGPTVAPSSVRKALMVPKRVIQ